MTALFYIEFLCVLAIAWCGVVAVMRFLERRFPALSRWLDEHVGPEPEWRKW